MADVLVSVEPIMVTYGLFVNVNLITVSDFGVMVGLLIPHLMDVGYGVSVVVA